MRKTTWIPLLCLSAFSPACVTSGTHQAKVAELDQALKREDDVKTQLARMTEERDRLQKQLDDTSALAAQLKNRLEQLGQDVSKLTNERGELAAGLQDAQNRLEELRKQKAAAEARAATFRTLVEKLRSMIDSGKLQVTIRRGRMQIVLPNDVLFDSGKTELKQAGKDAITQVAQVLATISDRRFLIAGHTDNVPIKTARFPSNWELSSARAIEVVRLLVAGGMKAELLGAAAYAEFDPEGVNDTPENRAKNRRIEIILEPNLSDLPSLDNLRVSEAK